MREKMKTAMPLLLTALCLLQPCLDVLSFFLEKGGFGNGLSSALRLLMLAVIALCGFVLSQRKRYYFALAAILAVFTGCHILACVKSGYTAPAADLANLLRIYPTFFPKSSGNFPCSFNNLACPKDFPGNTLAISPDSSVKFIRSHLSSDDSAFHSFVVCFLFLFRF